MATKPKVTSRVQQPITRPAVSNPQAYQGRVGNQFVGQQMWDPRGFWKIPNYGASGQELHIRPDGTKVLVKPSGGGAGTTVAGASAPSANTAAPPQYSTANLPPDATYDSVIGSLQKTRDDTIAGLIGDRGRTLTDYGFKEGPNGALTFDPNNPFSKASVMKQTYDTNRRSTGQSMGAGGQLYSGAYQNSQDLINRNQLQSEDALTKNIQGFLTRNTQDQTAAGTSYETAAGQAYGDRVGRFQTNPLYDPATAASTPAAATPVPAAAAGAAKPASSAALEVWQKGTYGGRKATYKNGKWYYTTASGKLAPIPI
jgi:hypothetical protein